VLTAVLVLQAFILLLIIVLSIVGWRKLTEDRRKLTEQLTEDQQKLTEQLTETSQKLTENQQQLAEAAQKLTEDQQQVTEQLTEDQQKLTEQLTETSQKLTQVLSIQLYDKGKLTEDQQQLTEKLTEVSQQLTEQFTEKRVSVSYEPIIRHEDRLFRNKVVASYRMQLHYDGLPIGDPTGKIVYSENKVDKEAVQNALTGALHTLQIAIEASGTPFRVLNTVDDVVKNLSKK